MTWRVGRIPDGNIRDPAAIVADPEHRRDNSPAAPWHAS